LEVADHGIEVVEFVGRGDERHVPIDGPERLDMVALSFLPRRLGGRVDADAVGAGHHQARYPLAGAHIDGVAGIGTACWFCGRKKPTLWRVRP